MKFLRVAIPFSLIVLSLILQACGGGGSGSNGQAQSTTVALQAQIKTGTPMGVFYNSSTATSASTNSWGPMMNYTLTSKANLNAGVTASDVNITSEVITYEYVGVAGGPGSSFVIPPLNYSMNMIVPVNGSTDLENLPVLSPIQKQYLVTNLAALPAGTNLTYTVRTTFNGYEVKNGNSVSVSAAGNVIIIK